MITNRWQFSLRALLFAITVLAVLIALVANHPKLALGLGLFAVCFLELVVWFVPAFMDLRGPKTTEEVRRERQIQNFK
jgi:hypothetical protein